MRGRRGLTALVLALALLAQGAPVSAAGEQVQVDNSTGNQIARGAVLRGDPGNALVTVTNGYHFWAAIDRLSPVGRADLEPAAWDVDLVGGTYASLGLIAPSATATYTGTFSPGGSQGVRVHYDFTSVGGREAIAANVLTVIADSLGAKLSTSSPAAMESGLKALMSLPGYGSIVQAMQQPGSADIWGMVKVLETMLGSETGRAGLIDALAEFGVPATDETLQAAGSVVGIIDWARTLVDLLSASWNGHTDGYDTFWMAAPVATPVLSGNWVAPKDGRTLDTATLTMSARVATTLEGVEITKVAYSIAWASHDAVAACSSKQASTKGIWACDTDLWKLGAPMGKPLTVSFTVYDDAGHHAVRPDGTRTISFEAVPPKPSNIRLTVTDVPEQGGGTLIIKIRWDEPKGAAITGYRLMWVTTCPNIKATKGTPCLVEGTPLAASDLRITRRLDGDASSVTLKIPHGGAGPGGLYEVTGAGALVLGASNRYGNSKLAIVDSARVRVDFP